jgi:hypothetical protein
VKKIIGLVVVAHCVAGLAFSATTQSVTVQINAFCIIAVTGNPTALIVSAPAQGGATSANPTDNTTYALYTSSIPTGTTRRIQANWGLTDAAPAGCSLLLTATPANLPNQGTSAGQISITSTATNIVTGIGCCATGTGSSNGAQMTYVLSINSMTALVANDNHSIMISLTLTDS